MLKAMGILSTSEPVKGIIVNPHGVEIGPDIPVLDSRRVANGVLGHLERAWIEDDSSLWGELIFTGRAGRRVYELIERGSLSGVSCRFETLCVAICDVDGDALDVEEALEWGPDDLDLVCIAQRSILTEISVTSVPADPACCMRALSFNAECWRMIKQGEAEL
jgi:hypothetical protein